MTNASDTASAGKPQVAAFQRLPDPDAATLADLRRRYDTGKISAAGIAREIGVSPSTAAKRLTEWGWRKAPKKKPASKRKSAKAPNKSVAKTRKKPPSSLDSPDGALTQDLSRLRKTLRDTASRHVRALNEKLSAATGEEDVERISRAIASLVKTLAELARIEGRNGSQNDRADNGPGATAAGSDLARIKSDLVERLIAASALEGGAPDTGEL